ncbi:hypothetical protein EVAR_20954_1 [Eumeta japonica]|uniref:Uncharacterized protein n=1 Tax=Eumeta variegata TaxID=151549 RepID=A0A4C1V4U5_EUMVA|nr:hypothetical protein EVAR_20954_1 [Eumeta japonica]
MLPMYIYIAYIKTHYSQVALSSLLTAATDFMVAGRDAEGSARGRPTDFSSTRGTGKTRARRAPESHVDAERALIRTWTSSAVDNGSPKRRQRSLEVQVLIAPTLFMKSISVV